MIPKNCTFCGLCCTLAVRLSGKDIRRIEDSGRKREEFAIANRNGELLLRRDKGWCMFFRQKGKEGRCIIYEHRPKECREFPGKGLCGLAENPIYNYMDKRNEETKRIMLLRKNAPASQSTTTVSSFLKLQKSEEKL